MASAAVTAVPTAIRLYHLTFYKCGSQWIRDILADPRIVEYSNHALTASGIDLQSSRWPTLAPGQFASPLYSTGTGEWKLIATPGDRAFVVIRDPRDIVVSLVFSVSLSHTPTPITLLLRDPIAAASPRHRTLIGMYLLAQWASYLRTWKDAAELPNVHLAQYESLIADLPGELTRLFQFLQWPVPQSVVESVAADNGFEVRAGRKPGTENQFSHRRKGIAGDWRNHMDRDLGRQFEQAFPSLLTELGYEQTDEWWQTLPESTPADAGNAELQLTNLLGVLAEHEQELVVVRSAAEERLRDVHILHAHIAELESKERARESSIAWRFGYRPLRALAALIHR